jgi:alanine dehydrogenase
MTLLLGEEDVREALDLAAMVDELAGGLPQATGPRLHTVPRINLPAGLDHGFLRIMPAVLPDLDVMGMKVFNGDRAVGYRYLVALWSISTGELLTLMDAGQLTAARTGAVTAVATRLMTAGRESGEIGVIGSGLEARTNLAAIAAAMEIGRAKVFSPNPEKRKSFSARMESELEIEVKPVDHPEQAADAPVVLVATNTGVGSERVALEGRWLPSEGHTSTIGSTMLGLREVDGDTFASSDLIVLDTEHARNESGDLLVAEEEGVWDPHKVRELPELLADRDFVASKYTRTVFKSVGTAAQDIIAANLVYKRALAEDRGRTAALLSPHFIP